MPYSATYRSTLHRDVSDALNIAADAPDEVKRWGIGVLAGGIMPGQHLGANAWQDADGTLNRLKEVYRTGSMEAMFTEGFRESERLLKEGNWDELERLGKGSGSIWRKLDPVEPGRIASLLDDPDRAEFERLRRVREEHTGAEADPRAINRYNELVAEGTKRDRAMRYVEKQRQENAFAMLAAITPDLTPEAMGVIERAVANDYRIADEDEGAFLTEEKGGLPRSQKELVAAYLGYCKPTQGAGAWGQFMQRMGEQAWDVTRHTGEEISDLFNLAMHRSFRRGGYREVLEQRAYLQQINQKNFADLGFWGNSFAEAGGILGYWTPMIASLFLTKGVGSLAGVKAAGAAGSIARGVGMAGRAAGPMVSHGMFVADFRQQFLQRIALDGGDPTSLETQAAAWIGAIAADAVEHISWGQMVGKFGMAEVQSQAYSKLVHAAAAKFGKKVGVDFGTMGLGKAALHVLGERGITTVFEAVEEALQQAIEEVVVDIGDGRTVRLGNLLEQSYGAFKATLGPMMLTALNPFAMAGRARSAVTMRNLDGDAIDRMLSSGERLKTLAAEGRLVRSDEDMGVLGGLMRMTAQAATEEDAQRALLERGFSAGQANTMLRTFAAIRRSAIEHGQTGELGPAMLQADEELARAGFSLSENPDGTTTATRIQTDGQGNKRRQTLKIAWGAFRELDMTSPAEVGSALDYIRQNASEGTKTTLRTLGLDIARPNAEIMADAAAMNALGMYVAENELGDVANSLATGTTKSKEADGTEIDEDTYTITLTEKATRESIWHEVGHAAGYALRRMGLSEEEIDAIQNWRSGEDGKAPSEADMALPEHAGAGGTELYGEERVNYELAGEIARKNEPKTAFARGLEYVGDLVRNVLRIRKKAEEDGNAAAVMTELIWHGHLGKLDTLNDAQKRVLLEARRRRMATDAARETPPPAEEPSSAAEGPSSEAEGTKPVKTIRPPDERTVANFCFDRPIPRDDMARLAASGELSEDDIFETGYRWSPFLRAWVVQPELKGQAFTPNGRYMGLDGEWHGEEARTMVGTFADGTHFVEVDDVPDEIRNETDPEKLRTSVRNLIREKWMNRIIDPNGVRVFVNGATAQEYVEPAKELDDNAFRAKMDAAGKLDEVVSTSTNPQNAPDGRDGHVHKNVKEWEYRDAIFHVNGRYYGTLVNIAVIETVGGRKGNFRKLHDITQIKDITDEVRNLHGDPVGELQSYPSTVGDNANEPPNAPGVNSENQGRPEVGSRRMYAAAQNLPSPEFAMDGTIVDALPAHLREDGRAIVRERGGTAAWMVEADGTPTELNEREWLRREAERRHEAMKHPLVAVHGLAVENLLKAIDEGAFVNPSIALRRADDGWTTPGYITAVNDDKNQAFVLFDRGSVEADGAGIYGENAWTGTVTRLKGRYSDKAIARQKQKWQETFANTNLKTMTLDEAREALWGTRRKEVDKQAQAAEERQNAAARKLEDTEGFDWDLANAALDEWEAGNLDHAGYVSRLVDAGATTEVAEEYVTASEEFAEAVKGYNGLPTFTAMAEAKPWRRVPLAEAAVVLISKDLDAETKAKIRAAGFKKVVEIDTANEGEILKAEREYAPRFQIGGVYTGSGADYANRSRSGGVDDGPSLFHIGSGEGSRVYGYGLYGSLRRGIAEHYANMATIGGTRYGTVRPYWAKFYVDLDGVPQFQSDLNSWSKANYFNFQGKPNVKAFVADACSRAGTIDGAIEEIWRWLAERFERGTSFATRDRNYEYIIDDYAKRRGEIAIAQLKDAKAKEKELQKAGKWSLYEYPDDLRYVLQNYPGEGEVSLFEEALKFLSAPDADKRITIRKELPLAHVYEQTFFTNRATPEETERHLLKWYDPASDEQKAWILAQLEKEGRDTPYLKEALEDAKTGQAVYELLAEELVEPEGFIQERTQYGTGAKRGDQSASEFLARAGIDGVKYPVDSYLKRPKDGDKVGWNYVSFRDDNIRVDHKWVDGEQRYQIAGALGAGRLENRRLADAEEMERSGATREDIWRETGWWRGADGKWRVEIADIRLTDDWKEKVKAGCQLRDVISGPVIDAYDNAIGGVWISVDKSLKGTLTSGVFNLRLGTIRLNPTDIKAKSEFVKTLAHEVQHTIQQQEGFALGTSLSWQMEMRERKVDMSDFPMAWWEYERRNRAFVPALSSFIQSIAGPWLRYVHDATIDEKGRVKFPYETKDEIPRINGRMIRSIGDIAKGVEKKLNKWKPFDIGGLARNGDLADVLRRAGADELGWFLSDALKASFDEEYTKWATEAQASYAAMAAEAAAWIEEADAVVKEISRPLDEAYNDAQKAYNTAGGEIEARMVEARLGLSDEQRMEIPPWVTEEVVSKDTIATRADYSYEAQRATMERMANGTAPAGEQKQAGTAYPDAGGEIGDRRFAVGAKRRADYKALLEKKRPDLDAGKVLAELDKYGNPKKEKVALHWVVTGAIRLPEDEYKVDEALSVAEKAKVDPFGYASPMELIEAHKEFKPTAKAIDPDTVPELSDRREMGYGVVTYLVQDTREGQAAMRRIIDTHWGEDANPWCLLAREKNLTDEFIDHMESRYPNESWRGREGEIEEAYEKETGKSPYGEDVLEEAWSYWQDYSARPKRVAFKDGKLLAFMATNKKMPEEELRNMFPAIEREYLKFQKSNEGKWLAVKDNGPMDEFGGNIGDKFIEEFGNSDAEYLASEEIQRLFDEGISDPAKLAEQAVQLVAETYGPYTGKKGNKRRQETIKNGLERAIRRWLKPYAKLQDGYIPIFTKMPSFQEWMDTKHDGLGTKTAIEQIPEEWWDRKDKSHPDLEWARDERDNRDGRDGGERRYMVSPTLATDIAEALEKDESGHYKKRTGAIIRFAKSIPIMDFLGVHMDGVFTTAATVRKMADKHMLTSGQIQMLVQANPVAVFLDTDGKGSHVILTDIMATPSKDAAEKPVMILLRPAKNGTGGYIASAYSRMADKEISYVLWRHHLRFIDENRIAGLNLEDETLSQLKPQASGNAVLTSSDYSKWSTSRSEAQSTGEVNGENARPAVGGRIREFDREAPYSPRGQLAALATMYLIQGKEPDRGNLQQIKERLGEQGDLDAIIAEAKATHGRILEDLKAKGRKASAGEIAREAARRTKAAHPEDLLEEAYKRGAAAGTWAQGARGAVLSTLIDESRSDSYHDFALEMGLDIAGIYHRFTLQQARKEDAAGHGKGAEAEEEGVDQALENAVGFAEGAQGPLDPNSEAGRALSELETRQQENIERALREADMDWEERNRLREERRQRRLEREREAEAAGEGSGEGEGGGGEAVEDVPEGMDENDLAVDILERNRVDIRDPWKFALFLRKAVRNRILKANGLPVDFATLDEALATEERLWQNPTNVAQFAKSMSAILRDMAARLMDHDGDTYPAVLVKLEQLSRMQNVRAIEIQAAFEIATIARRSIRETTGKMVEQTRTRLQKSYIGKHRFGEHDELEEDLKRKITGHVRRMAIWYKRVLGLTEGGIEREREKLLDRLSERNRALDEAAAQGVSAAKADEDAVATETLWKLKALDTYGGTRYLLPGEARERLVEMERWMATEGLKQAARIEEASRRYEKDRETIIKGCTVRDPATGEERTHEEDSKLDRFWRMTVNTINQRFRLLFVRASGQEGAAARELAERDSLRISQGTTRYEREKQEMRRALRDTVREVVGPRGVRAWVKHMQDKIPEEHSRALSKQGYRHLKYGQVMHMYCYLRQTATYGDNISRYGRVGQRQYIERNVLSSEDIKILNGMMRIYAEMRPELDPVSRDITGFEMKSPDPWYMPVKIKTPTRSGLETVVSTVEAMPAVFSERRKHNLDVDEQADIMVMFNDRMEQAARVLGLGRTGLDVIHTWGSADVKDAITKARGKKFTTALVNHLTDWMNGGRPRLQNRAGEDERFLNGLRTVGTYTALWGNVLSGLKQTLSSPVFALAREVGERSIFQDMREFRSDAWKQAWRELAESDPYKARYGDVGVMEETKEAIQGGNMTGRLEAVLRAGMKPIEWGDKTPGIIVGVGMYMDARDRMVDSGMDPDEAKRKAADLTMQAVEWTQQSSRPENQPEYARRGSSTMRILMMFASSPMLQAGWEVQRIVEYREKREAFGKDSKEARDAATALRNAIIINHVLMPLAFQAMAVGFNALLGRPPEKEDLLEGLYLMIIGPFSRILVISGLAHAMWRTATGSSAYGRWETAPTALVNLEQDVIDAVQFFGDWATWEPMEAWKDIDRFLRRNIAIYRHGRTAWHNWAEAE